MAHEDLEVLENIRQEYDIAYIAGERIFEGKKQYHVVWEDNWVNAEDLTNAVEKIQEYESFKNKEHRITSTRRKISDGQLRDIIVKPRQGISKPNPIHWLMQKSPKIYSCKECNKVYKRKDHLLRHQLCKHDKKRVAFCSLCKKKFTRTSSLDYHLRNDVCKKQK